ncbi:hypothetical protein LEMLEM_LOCUS15545 [Lemmus lemmus]
MLLKLRGCKVNSYFHQYPADQSTHP